MREDSNRADKNAEAVRGLLLVVSGPSGVGKGTLLGLLLSQRDDCVFSISATTRDPRPGEIDGEHYYFLANEKFERWVEEGRFLEWNQVFDCFYGTPREPVERHRNEGRHVILDVDVQGGVELIESVPDATSIFIAPPDLESLKKRLYHRGTETEEQIRKRLLTARSELKSLNHYQYTIINDTLELAQTKLNSIIESELCRTDLMGKLGYLPRFDKQAEEKTTEGGAP